MKSVTPETAEFINKVHEFSGEVCHSIFDKYKELNVGKEFTTRAGRTFIPKDDNIRFSVRLWDRIQKEIKQFIQENPASFETLQLEENKSNLVNELGEYFASMPKTRHGRKEMYTNSQLFFPIDIPVLSTIYFVACGQFEKTNDMVVPRYNDNKDAIKQALRVALSRHSGLEVSNPLSSSCNEGKKDNLNIQENAYSSVQVRTQDSIVISSDLVNPRSNSGSSFSEDSKEGESKGNDDGSLGIFTKRESLRRSSNSNGIQIGE